MRFLIISRPRHRVSLEESVMMLDAFAAWRDKYRSVSESFEFFAAGRGGFGVVNVEDEAALYQMMTEYPFSPVSDIEVQPLLSGDQALAMFQETVKARMAAMGGG